MCLTIAPSTLSQPRALSVLRVPVKRNSFRGTTTKNTLIRTNRCPPHSANRGATDIVKFKYFYNNLLCTTYTSFSGTITYWYIHFRSNTAVACIAILLQTTSP